MILIALGSNLAAPGFDDSLATCRAAVEALGGMGLSVRARSAWYDSAPEPKSAQPRFVNGVVAVATEYGPEEVLRRLHVVEARFGRRRRERFEARSLDLDLLCYHEVVSAPEAALSLPHPRLSARGFVLLPLRDVAPNWRCPRSGAAVTDMLRALPQQNVATLALP